MAPVLGIANAIVVVRAVDMLSRPMQGMASRVAQFGNTIAQVGLAMTAAGAIPLIGAAAKSIDAAQDFEKAMARIQTITKATDQETAALGQSLRDMSTDITRTTDSSMDLAKAYYEIAQYTQNAADQQKLLEATTKAATAGGVDTLTTWRAVQTMLAAYNLTANDAVDITDWMFRVVDRGQITMGELASQVADAAGTAAVANLTLEEFGGALSTITIRGYDASETMTQVRRAAQQLLTPTEAAKERLEAIGLAYGRAAIDSQGFFNMMRKINDAYGDNDEAIKDIFADQRAWKGAIALINDDLLRFGDNINYMGDRAGAAQKAFSIMTDTFSAKMQNLKNIFQVVGQDIGSILIDYLTPMIDRVRELATQFKNLSTEAKTGILNMAGAFVALGPGLLIVGSLTSALARLYMSLRVLTRATIGNVIFGGAATFANAVKGALELNRALANSARAATSATTAIEGFKTARGAVADLTTRIAVQDKAVRSLRSSYGGYSRALKDAETELKRLSRAPIVDTAAVTAQRNLVLLRKREVADSKAALRAGKESAVAMRSQLTTATRMTNNSSKLLKLELERAAAAGATAKSYQAQERAAASAVAALPRGAGRAAQAQAAQAAALAVREDAARKSAQAVSDAWNKEFAIAMAAGAKKADATAAAVAAAEKAAAQFTTTSIAGGKAAAAFSGAMRGLAIIAKGALGILGGFLVLAAIVPLFKAFSNNVGGAKTSLMELAKTHGSLLVLLKTVDDIGKIFNAIKFPSFFAQIGEALSGMDINPVVELSKAVITLARIGLFASTAINMLGLGIAHLVEMSRVAAAEVRTFAASFAKSYASGSVAQYTAEISRLEAQIAKLTPGTKRYNDVTLALAQAKEKLVYWQGQEASNADKETSSKADLVKITERYEKRQEELSKTMFDMLSSVEDANTALDNLKAGAPARVAAIMKESEAYREMALGLRGVATVTKPMTEAGRAMLDNWGMALESGKSGWTSFLTTLYGELPRAAGASTAAMDDLGDSVDSLSESLSGVALGNFTSLLEDTKNIKNPLDELLKPGANGPFEAFGRIFDIAERGLTSEDRKKWAKMYMPDIPDSDAQAYAKELGQKIAMGLWNDPEVKKLIDIPLYVDILKMKDLATSSMEAFNKEIDALVKADTTNPMAHFFPLSEMKKNLPSGEEIATNEAQEGGKKLAQETAKGFMSPEAKAFFGESGTAIANHMQTSQDLLEAWKTLGEALSSKAAGSFITPDALLEYFEAAKRAREEWNKGWNSVSPPPGPTDDGIPPPPADQTDGTSDATTSRMSPFQMPPPTQPMPQMPVSPIAAQKSGVTINVTRGSDTRDLKQEMDYVTWRMRHIR